jgi:hypothetical protein
MAGEQGPKTGVFGGEMPSLGGRSATADPLDAAFQVILKEMPALEGYMEALRGAGPAAVAAVQLTAEESFALQNEDLHTRFLKLQEKARKLADAGGQADPTIGQEAAKFAEDLTVHVKQIKSVHQKLGLPEPAYTGPRDVPKLSVRPDL